MADEATTELGVVSATDIVLNGLAIVTGDGTVINDLQSQALEIDLFQGIFSPCMSGSITVVDGVDLPGKYYFHGNEWCLLIVDKPGLKLPIVKAFRIFKISDYIPGVSSASYKMHLVSEQMINSNQTYVSKSYKGMLISDMISDIAKNVLNIRPKKLNVLEATTQAFDLIIPRLEPLEAIQWLTTRAYSATGTLFCFFETPAGFQFLSYEKMLQIDSRPYHVYYINKPKTTTEAATNIDSATYTNINQMHDIIATGKDGGYQSTLIVTDIFSRVIARSTLTAKAFKTLLNTTIPVNDSPGGSGNPLTSNNNNYVLKHAIVMDGDPTVNQLSPSKWLHSSFARLALLNSFKMTITVPGDLAITAGRVVELQVPMIIPQDQASDLNPIRSGRYLVTEVQHKIIFTNQNPMAATVLTLNSDSVSTGLPLPAINNAALKDILGS